MAKMITFFATGMLVISLWGAVMKSGGGIATTALAASISDTATTITVDSTENFLSLDVVTIGSEDILYSSKDATHFYVAADGRGYNGTLAKAHRTDTTVYTQTAGIVNQMSNYNISKIVDATGFWAALNIPLAFLSLLVNFLTAGLDFLGSDLQIVSYVWMLMGLGLVISIALSLAGSRRV